MDSKKELQSEAILENKEDAKKSKDNNTISNDTTNIAAKTEEEENELKTMTNEKKSKENITTENLSSFSKFIKKRSEYSGKLPYILKLKFNYWKNLTQEDEKVEKKTKKLLIKKTLNIHRAKNESEAKEKEQPKTLKIMKKKQITSSKNNENKRRERIIKFIESRFSSYISKKDLLKKYYKIWSTQVLYYQKVETKKISNVTINKKKINLMRKKDGKIELQVGDENNDGNEEIIEEKQENENNENNEIENDDKDKELIESDNNQELVTVEEKRAANIF